MENGRDYRWLLGSKMKRIMLNTNVFCRTFDDLTSKTIKEEAKYADFIFSLAHQNRIEIISSDVLYEETDLIENKAKYDSVYHLIKNRKVFIV